MAAKEDENKKSTKKAEEAKETKKTSAEAAPVEKKASTEQSQQGRGRAGKPRDRRGPGGDKGNGVQVDFEERVVSVRRVAKVVKGGRRFSFSALIIVGDKRGKVGFGLGKAKEVPEAIRKGVQEAQKRMIKVPINKGTIPHEILGEFDAGKILFKPAGEGTGIKAAGACRTILELAGVQDILTKSLRGNNSHNVVKATFMALKNLRSPDVIAKARGINKKSIRLKG